MAAALRRDPHRAVGRGVRPDVVHAVAARERIFLDRHLSGCRDRHEKEIKKEAEASWHDSHRR